MKRTVLLFCAAVCSLSVSEGMESATGAREWSGTCDALLRQAPTPPTGAEPVDQVPPHLFEAFTLNGQIPVSEYYVDDSFGGKGSHYGASRDEIVRMIERMRQTIATLPVHTSTRTDRHSMDEWILQALHRHSVKGMHVAVYGSTEPRWEAMLLAFGAARVTTIEYNRLTYSHEAIRTMTVAEYARSPEQFDAALSLSSFDHDGLGRYGDPVDAEADLRAMERARCALRSGGRLFMTVPVGPDALVWNLHRRYGPLRLPLMLRGWTVEERVGWDEARLTRDAPVYRSYEPVFVLRKDERGEENREEESRTEL